MNSVERVGAAIELRPPDRVPVDLHNFQPAAFATGQPVSEVLQDGELLAEAMLTAWREFRHDMILLENGTACSAQACGVEVIYRDDAAPAAVTPIVTSLEQVVDLEVPDPLEAFPMCEMIKATRILVRETAGRAWICGRADQGPFDLAAQLRGIDHFMLDIALGEQEDLVHALIDYARRVATRYAFALVEAGAHSTSIGESLAGPAMISPAHYRRYAFEPERRMVEDLRAAGIVLHNHICGNTGAIVEDFVATGAQVLEVDHKTDPRVIKEAAQGKTCLLGNIDTGLLVFGTPDEVDDACRELVELWKPGSGFILGPGCSLGPETPAENVHALVEAAERYGAYA